MASALLKLKPWPSKSKEAKIEDAVDSSWAALAAEGHPQGRGIGTLLVEAGAGQGRGVGAERRGGRANGRRDRGGAGALSNENTGRIHCQHSLIGRMSRARPTEGSEECVWELCSVSNQSSRAPSTRTVGRSSCKILKTYKVRQ